MNVAPISEKTIKPDFQAKKKKEQDFYTVLEKQEETYTKSKGKHCAADGLQNV